MGVAACCEIEPEEQTFRSCGQIYTYKPARVSQIQPHEVPLHIRTLEDHLMRAENGGLYTEGVKMIKDFKGDEVEYSGQMLGGATGRGKFTDNAGSLWEVMVY